MRQVEEPSHVVVFTDSDHAGCLKTGKSTSSSKLIYGSHLPRSTSTTQGVIALSLGESLVHKKSKMMITINFYLRVRRKEDKGWPFGLGSALGAGDWPSFLEWGWPFLSWVVVGPSLSGWKLALPSSRGLAFLLVALLKLCSPFFERADACALTHRISQYHGDRQTKKDGQGQTFGRTSAHQDTQTDAR